MYLVDTHAHINVKGLARDIPGVLERARSEGVHAIVNIGFDRRSSEESVDLSHKHEMVYASVGIHPHDAKLAQENDFNWIEKALSDPRVVAIGEIGLDFHYDNSPRDVQKRVFIRQLEIADKHKKKVIVHSREAAQETMDILFSYNVQAILHCFSGSAEMAVQYCSKGHMIGLGGAVTFRNAKKPVDVARSIDLSHLLLETDCPYMAPEPFRGRQNEPAYLKWICERIAGIREMDVQELADVTTANAERFFEFGVKNGT